MPSRRAFSRLLVAPDRGVQPSASLPWRYTGAYSACSPQGTVGIGGVPGRHFCLLQRYSRLVLFDHYRRAFEAATRALPLEPASSPRPPPAPPPVPFHHIGFAPILPRKRFSSAWPAPFLVPPLADILFCVCGQRCSQDH